MHRLIFPPSFGCCWRRSNAKKIFINSRTRRSKTKSAEKWNGSIWSTQSLCAWGFVIFHADARRLAGVMEIRTDGAKVHIDVFAYVLGHLGQMDNTNKSQMLRILVSLLFRISFEMQRTPVTAATVNFAILLCRFLRRLHVWWLLRVVC